MGRLALPPHQALRRRAPPYELPRRTTALRSLPAGEGRSSIFGLRQIEPCRPAAALEHYDAECGLPSGSRSVPVIAWALPSPTMPARTFMWRVIGIRGPTIRAVLEKTVGVALSQFIEAFAVPPLVDRNIPAELQRYMADRAKVAKGVAIAGGSHAPMVSRPDAVAALVKHVAAWASQSTMAAR